MSVYRVTTKRSFIGNLYYYLLRFSGFKKKLATSSITKLQAYEDQKTPVKKAYLKEIISGVTLYWISKQKRGNGILVYLPGGGFIIGPTKLHWVYADKMSDQLDMAVLVIRYNLAPQEPFPMGLNGIVNAITVLQKRNVLNQNWFLAGESAGGNLTLAACYKLKELNLELPRKVMLLYPSVDMTETRLDEKAKQIAQQDIVLSLLFTRNVLAAYAKNQDLNNALLSPVNGDVAVLPPVLLQHGTADILVQGSVKLAEKMGAAGKSIQFEKYEGMFHGFILYPGLPEAKKAIQSQVKFLKN